MNIALLQTNIIWEDIDSNLRRLHERLKTLRETTEIVVLPEMFTTGFSMNCTDLAEEPDGRTIGLIREWAREFKVALCGSFICREHTHHYNRAFFITPHGQCSYYNKRHLFRMGNETEVFTPGEEHTITEYNGWKICLMVCYDLRFPVWSRNTGNSYDLLIYVANWPASRRDAWDTLLKARSIENMCYTCGVNRVGTDGNGLRYNGGTVAFSPKGARMAQANDEEEQTVYLTLDKPELTEFRNRFPAWKDADLFNLAKKEP